jgi:hypothetical protein
VKDNDGQQLAYVHYESEPGRRCSGAELEINPQIVQKSCR